MPLRVNSNVSSVFVQKNLGRSQNRLQGNFEKLSSGLRINRAADDAAGLAISEKMRAHMGSLKQAMRNTSDGINMVQTAEGALSETSGILSRMRELAVQSSSEVLQATERAYLQTEFAALQSEIDRISDVTEFNGLNLADGSTASVDVQVGIFAAVENQITVNLQDATTTTLAVDTATVDVSSSATALAAITAIDTALDSVANSRAEYGAIQNRLGATMNNLENYHENLTASESSIRDVDFASETADMARNNVMTQAGVSVLSQANQSPQAALSLLQ